MNKIFLGKPWHWLLLVVLMGGLWWMGSAHLQTRNFTLFLGILLGLTTVAVLTIWICYRPGDSITREPFDGD